MAIAVLIGKGPNRVQYIALVFESLAAGEAHMDAIWKEYEGQTVTRSTMEMVTDDKGNKRYERKNIEKPLVTKEVKEDKIIYDFDYTLSEVDYEALRRKGLPEENKFMKQFYTDYYDGCGGVYGFILQEVEFGKPIVEFDLD